MPNYVKKALACLHPPPSRNPQNPPHPYNDTIYGHKRQLAIPTITNEKLTPAKLKHFQKFSGFSIIILEPLKTPYKQPSVPAPPPFQLSHGKISSFE